MANPLVYVNHPTDRPNYCIVSIGDIDLYFSYQTIIAFAKPGVGIIGRKNEWGPTTGKHLNLAGPFRERLDGDEFERRLADLLSPLASI